MANPSEIRVVPLSVVVSGFVRLILKYAARASMIIMLAVSISAPGFAAPVDVNSADAQSLSDALMGIGPAIAKAIVDYRAENGPFTGVEDLLKVKGVGPKTLERNKEDIIIGGQESKSVAE